MTSDARNKVKQTKITERQTKISKYLSKHLRHQPERLGLELFAGGWVNVEQLLAATAANGFEISLAELQQVVTSNDKQRFAFNDTGELIRANQGHSIEVDLQLTAKIPPDILYHGTHLNAIEPILATGLDKMSRHHVHLTTDLNMAHHVGGRRGKSAVLVVNAIAMIEDGYEFYCTDNDVWLVDTVPPQYLELLSSKD
jgi:putative RNA 2'-phosphotransferase